MSETKRGAVLQFEIDRKRWLGTRENLAFDGRIGESPSTRLIGIAKTAVADTLKSGGTFVLVATPDKITMIQRPDAEDI